MSTQNQEQTSLVKVEQDESVRMPDFTNEDFSVVDAFSLPKRNWNVLIDNYTSRYKKVFFFNALQCSVILEYVKKGIPIKYLLQTIGCSHQRFNTMILTASDLEDRLEELRSKPNLSNKDKEELEYCLSHPLRLFISDIQKAEGVSALADFENFNNKAEVMPDLLLAKMKAKYKDIFSEKTSEGGNVNVQINLASGWVEELD